MTTVTDEKTRHRYELVVIVDAADPQEKKEGTIKAAADAITKFKGSVQNSQVWLDKQKFTFRMKKKTEGTYYLVNFEAPTDSLPKIREALRLNDGILRSLIVSCR